MIRYFEAVKSQDREDTHGECRSDEGARYNVDSRKNCRKESIGENTST
jgi:hypothetical protein